MQCPNKLIGGDQTSLGVSSLGRGRSELLAHLDKEHYNVAYSYKLIVVC